MSADKFTPKTYQDAVDAGEFTLAADQTKVPCDGCGRRARLFVLVDVRGVPGVAGDFLCDGCRATMHRNLTPVDGGPPIQNRREWLERWMKSHGAPEQVLAKVRGLRLSGAERDREKRNVQSDNNPTR